MKTRMISFMILTMLCLISCAQEQAYESASEQPETVAQLSDVSNDVSNPINEEEQLISSVHQTEIPETTNINEQPEIVPLPDDESGIDSEIKELLYSYYNQYSPLLGDEDSDVLQVNDELYGRVNLRMKKGCYENLKNSLADLYSSDDNNWAANSYIHRADKEILSCLSVKPLDDMGVQYVGHTFDVASGEELTIEDVVVDLDSLKGIIAEQTQGDSTADLAVWTVGYEGLTVYMQADAEKAVPVYISYEQYPDLFVERLQHAPTGYAVGFDQYTDLILDVDEDGEPDMIHLELEEVEENNGESRVSNLIVTIDGNEISFPPVSYYARNYGIGGYFIQNNDGKKYIYIYSNGELDFEWYYDVIRLGQEGPVYVGYEAFNIDYAHAITDPQRVIHGWEDWIRRDGFNVHERHGVFLNQKSYFHVNMEGYLEENDKNFYYGVLCTATEDVEGIRVSVDGTVSEDTVTITEGESALLFRTDNETYTDYILVDGSICRISM